MPKVEIQSAIGDVITSWFPWVTSGNCDILDRNLNRRISSMGTSLELAAPEILTALRWYNQVPDGFRSSDDECVAGLLEERLQNYSGV